MFKIVTKKINAFLGESEAILEEEAPLSLNYTLHSLQSVLPYESFDEQRALFFNRGSCGFVLECAPLLGCSDEMLSIIARIIRELPSYTFLQVHCYATPRVGNALDSWCKSREKQSEALAVLSKKRTDWLKEHALTPQYDGIGVRDFRVFWTVSISSQPFEMDEKAKELLQLKESLKHQLASLNLPLREVNAQNFIHLIQELMHPEDNVYASTKVWNERERIATQCLDLSFNTEVYSDHIRFKKSSIENKAHPVWVAQTFIPTEYPKMPTLWGMAELIGDTFNESLRQPFPFLLTLSVEMQNASKAEAKAEASYLDRDGKMKGTAAKFIPRLKREHADWHFIRERLEDGEKLVKIVFQGVVFSPQKFKQEAFTRFSSLFTAKQWKLVLPSKVQWPLFLASLPMVVAEGYFDDLRKLGMVRTVTSFNAANVLPLQGEMKGQDQGQLFVGRKGQLYLWDPFSYQGDNYNVAVAATSGVGKSTAIQDYIVNLLADKGRAWVIDIGRNYFKSCQWLKGEFLAFGKDSRLILNPFSNLLLSETGEISDEAFALLKPLLGLMARPTGATTEEEMSWLEQAIQGAFSDFGPDTTITAVAAWLKSQPHPTPNNLATLLYPYTKQGMYSRWFEGKSDLNFDNPFIVLELEELALKRDLREVVLMLLMHHIHTTMYLGDRLQKKSCIIDEAWDLLQSNNTNSAKFIENGYRRARRYRGNFITITQGLDDYYKNLASKAALDCSGTLWLLKHKADSIQYLEREKKLPFSGFQLELFKQLHKGKAYSESLLINDEGTRVLRLPLDPFSRILYSSKGEEFEAVKALQERGLSLLQAVEKVAAVL